MNPLALQSLGLAPMPEMTVHGRVVTALKTVSGRIRERMDKIAAVLSDNRSHDTNELAQRIGEPTKQTWQALRFMAERGEARRTGRRVHGMTRVVVWRKA